MDKKILIIDDDNDLAMITSDVLSEYGYEVKVENTAAKAYETLESEKFQIIILDINLPDETGFEVCKELRKVSTVPIIFASARTSEDDRVVGLDIGADDYLPKPYSLKELLSRINATYRRTYGFTEQNKVFTFGDIEINEGTRRVSKAGVDVPLSLKEYDLLFYLVTHRDVSIKKETLLSEVWGAFSNVEISTVAVHIRWLREKLEDDPAKPKYIKTVWGIGYCLNILE